MKSDIGLQLDADLYTNHSQDNPNCGKAQDRPVSRASGSYIGA